LSKPGSKKIRPFPPLDVPAESATETIEAALAEWAGRRYCCLTNRGTTALTAALAALEEFGGKKCVFPASMCSVPVFAAPFAGWEPVFADVSLEDGNFDLVHLQKILERHRGEIGAVVPVHMFGQPEKLKALQLICDLHDIPMIEDVALSMGAKHNGRRLGSFGKISCLSFVRKMIPLEMGGAVLTDDPDLHRRAREFVARLPVTPTDRDEISAAMKAFHSMTGYVAVGDWKNRHLLRPFRDEFRRLLLKGTREEDWKDSIVLDELEALDGVLSARRVRAEVYETVLDHPSIEPLRHDESCLFAYPVRLKGIAAEDFLAFAAEHGCSFRRVAYPVVAPVFEEAVHGRYPNAYRLEREVIGLPVDDDQPVSAFWDYAQDFMTVFREYVKIAHKRPPFPWRGKLELRMG
jgi:dTDP-4-amino-4,6-dideoxygalactose transaminase